MLLPSPWMSFRTWRPRRGPVQTLLKDGRSGHFFWLTGGQASLWETLEPGCTRARLRRQATSLGLDQALEALIGQWLGEGLLRDLMAPQPDGATDAASASGWIGKATTEDEARAQLRAWGCPFEALWDLGEPIVSQRQAMDRLDFLRESGVFQIRFINGPFGAPAVQRIQLAASAQGFSVIND